MALKKLPEWVKRVEYRMKIVSVENKHKLAKLIDAPYTTVSTWFSQIKSVRRPPAKYAERLCAVLKCSKEYLYFGDDKKQSEVETIYQKIKLLKEGDRLRVEDIVDTFLSKTLRK